MSLLPVPACCNVISSPLRQYYAASGREAKGSGFGVRYCEEGVLSRVHVRRVSTVRNLVRFTCARQLLARLGIHDVVLP